MATQQSLDLLIRKLRGIQPLPTKKSHAIRSSSATVRRFSPGQDIAPEGSLSSSCCVVIDGWTCCYRMLDGGRRQILSFHIVGDVPDVQSLHLPCTDIGMAALTVATVAFVPHAELRELIARVPSFATALWHEALAAAAINRAWLVGLGRRDARGRMSHLFCELYLRLNAVGLAHDHTLPMPLRQPDLADALGLTSVHVNRTLRDLRAGGLIRLRNRTLEILDWPGLRKEAEFDPSYLHLLMKGAG